MKLTRYYKKKTFFFLMFYLVNFVITYSQNSFSDVIYKEIELKASDKSTFISGYCRTLIDNSTSASPSIFFELTNNLTIDSIILNGVNIEYLHKNDSIIINIGNFNDTLYHDVIVYYNGYAINEEGRGLLNSNGGYKNQNVTWSLCEPYFTKNWLPVKQNLNDKIDSIKVSLIVDSRLFGVSNGNLITVDTLKNDKFRYVWKSNYPIAYYLISITVSDYLLYEFDVSLNNGKEIKVSNFIYNSVEYYNSKKSNIDKTKDLLILYSELFGDYPFEKEKYGHVTAPIGGGMEHQTITTISDFNFNLVAHELAHQWWGNYVTCSSWKDIWINEGFASYAEYLALEFLYSKKDAQKWMYETRSNVLSDNTGSIYVNDTSDTKRIFSMPLSYDKGAVFIHLIRQQINDDALFFQILKEFLKSKRNGYASGEDFKNIAEEISNTDFTDLFNDWYYGEGFPEIYVKWFQEKDLLSIEVTQDKSYDLNLKFKAVLFDNTDTILIIKTNSYDNIKQYNLKSYAKDLIYLNDSVQLCKLYGIEHFSEDEFNRNFIITQDYKNQLIRILNYTNNPYILKVYNLQGQIMLIDKINLDETYVDYSNYVKGLHVIEITRRGRVNGYQLKLLFY